MNSSTPAPSSPQHVGVVGLGAMGGGMARSLRRAGHTVHVADVRPGVAAAFPAEGGVPCD
jgi:3-hydroxyisobutyrate dehydrogenase